MIRLRARTDLISSAIQKGEAIIVTLRGEVDLHNSPELRNALLEIISCYEPRKLILELLQVPYMDSSAVAVLVEMLQKIRVYGGRIILIHLQPRVQGLLEIARLDTIFILARDEAEALAK